MFYIQTQDGELPYIYKTFKTQAGARKAVAKFLEQNKQEGAIAIVTACHSATNFFYRESAYGRIVEEVRDQADLDNYTEIEHGYEVAAR